MYANNAQKPERRTTLPSKRGPQTFGPGLLHVHVTKQPINLIQELAEPMTCIVWRPLNFVCVQSTHGPHVLQRVWLLFAALTSWERTRSASLCMLARSCVLTGVCTVRSVPHHASLALAKARLASKLQPGLASTSPRGDRSLSRARAAVATLAPRVPALAGSGEEGEK